MKNAGAILAVLKRKTQVPPWAVDGFVALTGIYLIHYLFCSLFVRGMIPANLIEQPFSHLPFYIFVNSWDAAYYRDLYVDYSRYFFPPLYPMTLRAVTALFWLGDHGFVKSAVLLNLFSHVTIVLGLAYYLQQDPRTKGIPIWPAAFLLLFYPGHNVFFAAYSESFFLALSVTAFLLRAKDKLLWASLVAGVSFLARLMGIFLVSAFVAEQIFYCIRDRKIYWRKVGASIAGFVFVLGWHLYLYRLGTSPADQLKAWTEEFMHLPNPHLAIFQQLAYAGRPIDIAAFWIAVPTAVYCAVRKRYLEMFYIVLFYLSLAVFLYRPYPWSRYVSVLFPIQVMFADFLKNKPKLALGLIAASIVYTYRLQIQLFQGHIGEP
jgi:hypothetical protein